MSLVEKKSIKSCLKNLCGIKKSIRRDYECLPYNNDEMIEKKTQVIKDRNNLAHLNRLPMINKVTLSDFSQNVKITSTSIETPVKSSTTHWGTNTNNSQLFSQFNSESSGCSSESSCESSDFQMLYSSATEESGIYVCQYPYKAEYDGDIELKYTERVHVVHATEEFTLVKKISDSDECGYVSTRCLTSLEEFMKKF